MEGMLAKAIRPNPSRMEKPTALWWIKLLHTAIWIFFNLVILYMVYAVATRQFDGRLWVCYGLIVLEGLVLLVFRLYCPLTVWARKYSDSGKDNFDIFLPNWLARYNKLIYTSIVVLVAMVHAFRYVTGR